MCIRDRPYSIDYSQWTTYNSTLTLNSTTALDGSSNASTITTTVSSGGVYKSTGSGVSNNNTSYTMSTYYKNNGSPTNSKLIIGADNVGVGAVINVDLNTNIVTSNTANVISYTVSPSSNGWYRCSLTFTVTPSYSSGSFSFVQYVSANSSAYIWGSQLEQANSASSYIPTAGIANTRVADVYTSTAQSRSADAYSSTTSTRSADNASMTGSNFSSWYRQDQGTIYSEFNCNVKSPAGVSIISSLLGASTSNRAELRIQDTALKYIEDSNGVSYANFSLGNIASKTFHKGIYAYQTGIEPACVNGGSVISTSGICPNSIVGLYLGSDSAGNNSLNGYLKRIAYFPVSLSNTELQLLTTT